MPRGRATEHDFAIFPCNIETRGKGLRSGMLEHDVRHIATGHRPEILRKTPQFLLRNITATTQGKIWEFATINEQFRSQTFAEFPFFIRADHADRNSIDGSTKLNCI